MKPSELKAVLTELIRTQTNVTTFIHGQHGSGKSALVRQVANELGYNILTIILSQKEAVDLAGIPYVFEDAKTKDKVTVNYMPDWFSKVCERGKTVIFLDEFNMARRETMAAAFELVLDRRLNNKYLPKDVVIVAAGNPEDERYDVTPMSESLLDRFMHIQLVPEVSEWLNWAKDTKVHQDIINFIQVNPQSLYTKDSKDAKFPVKIKHSGRSYERASQIYNLNIPQEIKQECLFGIIGLENTTAFIKGLEANQEKPLTGEQCVTDLNKVTNMFSKWSKKRNDLITVSRDNFNEYVKLNKVDPEVICSFLAQLPQDLAIEFLQNHVQQETNQMSELLDFDFVKNLIEEKNNMLKRKK